MHMLHIDGKVRPDKKREFLQAWNNEILPLMKQQNGFVDEILLLGDDTNPANAGIDLSFWDAMEPAEQYRYNVFEKTNCNLEHLMEAGFTVHICGCDAQCFKSLTRYRAA